jgi:hypothetical protein
MAIVADFRQSHSPTWLESHRQGLQHNALFSMKSIIDMSMSRRLMHAAMYGRAPERSDGERKAHQASVKSWAARAMWLLVAVTSLWDIAVTFDRHFELTTRLF